MNERQSTVTDFKVRRGDLDSICIYEVTEDELDTMENGSPTSLYLNFSLVLLPTSISFFASIATTEINSTRTFLVFLCIAIISAISGVILIIIWFFQRKSSKNIFKKIKNRLKEEIAPRNEGEDSITPRI